MRALLRNSLRTIHADLMRDARRVKKRSKIPSLGEENQQDLAAVASLLTEAAEIFRRALDADS